MAQPAVDLPDPLNGGNLAGVANADDLLSQLAGDEIDRLLAESDSDPVPAAPSGPAAIGAAATAGPAAPQQGVAVPPTFPASTAAAPPETPSSTEAALDEVLAASAPIEIAAPRVPQVERRSVASATAVTSDVSAAEPVARVEATALQYDTAPQRVGLLVKPLLWINAPVAKLSESQRDLVGKIALVTLINALAVLAYVLLFVRHRH